LRVVYSAGEVGEEVELGVYAFEAKVGVDAVLLPQWYFLSYLLQLDEVQPRVPEDKIALEVLEEGKGVADRQNLLAPHFAQIPNSQIALIISTDNNAIVEISDGGDHGLMAYKLDQG